MRPQRVIQTGRRNLVRQLSGANVARSASGVFRLVVIPAICQDFRHAQRAVAHDSAGQLPSRQEGFDHHGLGHLVRQFRRSIRVGIHQIDTDGRPLIIRLHHIGRRHDVIGHHGIFVGQNAFRNRQASSAIHILGALFIHRQRRRQHTRMRVRQTHPFQNALHTAVFAPTAMQTVEHNIRRYFGKAHRQIGACIDLNHFESYVPQSSGAFTPRAEGNLAFSRGSAHQYRHFRGCPARHSQSPLVQGSGQNCRALLFYIFGNLPVVT